MLISNHLIGFGVGEADSWIVIPAAAWQGDTGSFTLGTGTLTANAADVNVRTANDTVASSQDFDMEYVVGAGTYDFSAGFSQNANVGTGVERPGNTDPIVFARESGGGGIGWVYAGTVTEASRSSGWTASAVIGLSRRGSTFYGLIDGSINHTFSAVSGTNAGKFFIGCNGTTSGWSMTGIRYRLGPGLPTLS